MCFTMFDGKVRCSHFLWPEGRTHRYNINEKGAWYHCPCCEVARLHRSSQERIFVARDFETVRHLHDK